jgi:hypothetical protein
MFGVKRGTLYGHLDKTASAYAPSFSPVYDCENVPHPQVKSRSRHQVSKRGRRDDC